MATTNIKDPSQETKIDLTETGISSFLEYGQAARFLLKNSALQDSLQKTAKNFLAVDKTVDATNSVINKLASLTTELQGHSNQIAACLEVLPRISSSLEDCHNIARAKTIHSSPISDNYTLRSRLKEDEISN